MLSGRGRDAYEVHNQTNPYPSPPPPLQSSSVSPHKPHSFFHLQGISQPDLHISVYKKLRVLTCDSAMPTCRFPAESALLYRAVAGNTPLHLACDRGLVGNVRLLLEWGADVTARNEAGALPADVRTALDFLPTVHGDYFA